MINDKIFDHLDYDEWVKNRLITIRRFQKIRATYLQECQHEIFWQQDCQLLRIFLKNFDAPREGKLDLASVQSDSELSAEDLSLIKSDDSSSFERIYSKQLRLQIQHHPHYQLETSSSRILFP